MPKISILMPAYNAEKYISTTIESVLKQTFTDWELVIIDDCSRDTTGEMCDDYAKRDSRIKVFHQQNNQGISASKNMALRFAEGEYVGFCDDDDIMHPKALEDNINLIERTEAEIARWSYRTIKVNEVGEINGEIERKCKSAVYQSREAIFADYRNVHELLSCDWTGLYRRDFLKKNNINFNLNYRYGGEDTEFNIRCLRYANKMVMNEKIYYEWYLRRGHSTTAKRNINFCYTMIDVVRKEYFLLKDNCHMFLELWKDYEADYRKLIVDYSERLPDEDKKVVQKIMEEKEWWINERLEAKLF